MINYKYVVFLVFAINLDFKIAVILGKVKIVKIQDSMEIKTESP